MTHLTPEEQAALEYVYLTRPPLQRTSTLPCESNHALVAHNRHNRLVKIAAEAIEQRAALAGMVVLLREAADGAKAAIWDAHYGRGLSVPYAREATEKIAEALALPLPDAAKQVAEWREKSELLELSAAKGWFISPQWDEEFGVTGWDIKIKQRHGSKLIAYGNSLVDALRAAKEAEDVA